MLLVILLVVCLSICAAFVAGAVTQSWRTQGYSNGYPVNARGEIYGPEDDAETPDLIAVQLQNGKSGYIRRSEMNAVDGSSVSNPEEAVAYMD